MSRRIADPNEAAETPETETPATEKPIGSVFIKNQTNELLRFPDGKTYLFKNSREEIVDSELAEAIRALADKPNNPHGIFEVTQ